MLLLVDANVLIDYAMTDSSILALVVCHIGPVYVPRDVLDEVAQLDEDACTSLGLQVVEGSLEQLVEAAAGGGGLSFQDWMCLLLARDGGYVCVTNDRRLLRACQEAGVQTRRGLRLMLDLVAVGSLEAEVAIEVAEAMGQMNGWLKPAVVSEFKRLARLSRQ